MEYGKLGNIKTGNHEGNRWHSVTSWNRLS